MYAMEWRKCGGALFLILRVSRSLAYWFFSCISLVYSSSTMKCAFLAIRWRARNFPGLETANFSIWEYFPKLKVNRNSSKFSPRGEIAIFMVITVREYLLRVTRSGFFTQMKFFILAVDQYLRSQRSKEVEKLYRWISTQMVPDLK